MIAAARYIKNPDEFHQGIHRLLSPEGIAILSYADTLRRRLRELFQSEKNAGLTRDDVRSYPRPTWFAETKPKFLQQLIWSSADRIRDMSIRVLKKQNTSFHGKLRAESADSGTA